MTRILTVDDSRAIRTIVSKQVREFGFEVEEAEDGELGLAKLEESTYDLVLLDVTMPVLDGPGMLAKMRERGDNTPVLMLTSESKRSIVGEVMKLGISDYILKPFKPEELKAKVWKALKLNELSDDAKAAIQTGSGSPATDAGKHFIDVLVIDDMENVSKKLRTLLPPHLTMSNGLNGHGALGLCRDNVFRVVLIDHELPDVNSATLAGQLRLLQANAIIIALCLKTTNDVTGLTKQQGFDGVLFKPFDPSSIEDLIGQHFGTQSLLSTTENVLSVAPFSGRAEHQDKYFFRIGKQIQKPLEEIAGACFDDVIVDFTQLPADSKHAVRLVISTAENAKNVGLQLRMVMSKEVRALLAGFTDTASLAMYDSLSAAKAA